MILIGKYRYYLLSFLIFSVNLGTSVKSAFLLFLLFLMGCFNNRKFKVNISFIIFLFFCIIYSAMIYFSNNDIFGLHFSNTLFFLLIFFLGINIKLNETELIRVILVSAFFLTLTPITSILVNFYSYGFIGNGSRSIPYYFSKDIDISATVMAGLLLPGVLFFSLFVANYKYKLFLLSYISIFILCSIRLGSRTLVLLMLIIFLLGYFYNFRVNFRKMALTSLFFIALIYLYYNNLDFFLNYFNDRLEASDTAGFSTGGGRYDRWVNSFDMMLKQPFGWSYELYGFAHNMFLDVARTSGLYSALILLFWSIYSLSDSIKSIVLFKNKILKCLLVSNILIFYIVIFLEPIFDGFVYYFAFYLFIIALVKGSQQSNTNGKF